MVLINKIFSTDYFTAAAVFTSERSLNLARRMISRLRHIFTIMAMFFVVKSNMEMMDHINLSTCRNLTVDEVRAYAYIPAKRVFISALVPLIAVFGILANAAFLLVLLRIPYMRTATNFYLANLAVSDGVLLIVASLRYMWTYFDSPTVDFKYGTPFRNTAGCVVPVLLTSLFNFVSVFLVTWVAMERYNAVCRPLLYRRNNNRVQAMKLTMLAWFITLAYISPHGLAITLKKLCWRWPVRAGTDTERDHVRVMNVCEWNRWAVISISLFDLGQFSIALIVNCTLYIKIVCKLNDRQRKERNMVGPRIHVAKMLAINALVFFGCLAPYQLINIADVIEMFTNVRIYTGNTYNLFLWFGRVVFLLNSTINPVIYNVSNSDYRQAFVCAFCCGDRLHHQNRFGKVRVDGGVAVDNEMRGV